jgi:hypothetical protein
MFDRFSHLWDGQNPLLEDSSTVVPLIAGYGRNVYQLKLLRKLNEKCINFAVTVRIEVPAISISLVRWTNR